jgi:hypothetical protein
VFAAAGEAGGKCVFEQVRVDAAGRADGDDLRARRALAPSLLD